MTFARLLVSLFVTFLLLLQIFKERVPVPELTAVKEKHVESWSIGVNAM